MTSYPLRCFLPVLLAGGLSACALLNPQLDMARAVGSVEGLGPTEALEGISGRSDGEAQLGERRLSYRRAGDRMELGPWQSGSMQLSWRWLDAPDDAAGPHCVGGSAQISLPGLNARRPWALGCQMGEMVMQLWPTEAAVDAKIQEMEGDILSGGAVRYRLRSLHQVGAGRVPQVLGYVIREQGRVVALVDVSTKVPTLRVSGDTQEAARLRTAALTLALMRWPPSAR